MLEFRASNSTEKDWTDTQMKGAPGTTDKPWHSTIETPTHRQALAAI